MRMLRKPSIAVLVGAMLLMAAPVVYGDGGGNDGHGGKSGKKLDVVGLTQDSRLISFEDDKPDKARDIGKITGLSGDTSLVGIDYRPSTGNDGSRGVLYGLGNAGGVYTIDRDARATKRSQLSVALNGSFFGVDFNPAVDRLRIISDTGQNLRHNVDAPTGGTLVDTPLTYPPATTPAAGVTGAAYTNNDSDPNTGTTLFDIDSTLDQEAIQSPANSGQLAAVGKLGVDTNAVIGSDIYSTIRGGTTVDLRGLASLTVGGEEPLLWDRAVAGPGRRRSAPSAPATK